MLGVIQSQHFHTAERKLYNQGRVLVVYLLLQKISVALRLDSEHISFGLSLPENICSGCIKYMTHICVEGNLPKLKIQVVQLTADFKEGTDIYYSLKLCILSLLSALSVTSCLSVFHMFAHLLYSWHT